MQVEEEDRGETTGVGRRQVGGGKGKDVGDKGGKDQVMRRKGRIR